MQLRAPMSFLFGKSVTYLPTLPLSSPASMASSSTISARDSFMMRTPGRMAAMASASIMW